MPELPEVETVKRGLEPVLTGSYFVDVLLNRQNLRYPFPPDFQKKLINQKILRLRRRGKYICVDLENSETLVCHLGMSGSFTINPAQEAKHDHVIFKTNNKDIIVYNDPRRFGMMFILASHCENDHSPFKDMGEEPLGNNFNADYLMSKLNGKSTAIKIALLDQNIVAGVGNIYACEALYEAEISPLRQSQSITKTEADNLVVAIRNVLERAILSGGSTLKDYRHTNGQMGYFQHQFHVYDRAGHKCPRTNGQIIKITQGGRSTFYCPDRQK